MANPDVFLQFRAAQIQVAVAKRRFVFHAPRVGNLKRRGLRRGEHLHALHVHFHRAGGNVGVDGTATAAQFAVHGKHVFGAGGKRFVEHFFVGVLVKRELNDTRAVAQVDKNERAKIALALYPAHHANVSADVLFVQRAAIVGAFIRFT